MLFAFGKLRTMCSSQVMYWTSELADGILRSSARCNSKAGMRNVVLAMIKVWLLGDGIGSDHISVS